jgi:hypothetical protein
MKKPLLLIISLLLSAPSANAQTIRFAKQECLNTSISEVHSSVLDYNGIQDAEFSKYRLSIPGLSDQVLLEVSQSRSKNVSQSADTRIDLVQIVMKPWDVTNASLYPKFILQCSIVGNSQTQFQQICEMRKDLTHFGLSDFKSSVHASLGSDKCKTGSVLIQYDISLVPMASEIALIQKEVTGDGPLASAVGKMFSDQFFRLYYENYYDGWKSSLQK